METVSIKFPAEMRDRLKTLARSNERTFAAEVRVACSHHLDSNGSSATSPEANARAITKGA